MAALAARERSNAGAASRSFRITEAAGSAGSWSKTAPFFYKKLDNITMLRYDVIK